MAITIKSPTKVTSREASIGNILSITLKIYVTPIMNPNSNTVPIPAIPKAFKSTNLFSPLSLTTSLQGTY